MFFKIKKKKEKNVKKRLDELHIKMNQKKIKEEFDNIMRFSKRVLEQVKEIEKDNGPLSKEVEHPMVDVVRLIGRKIQTQYLTNLLYEKYESGLPSLFPE